MIVGLEVLVVDLLQTFKGCSVLVIADACNLDVIGPEVLSGRKEGCDVGNKLWSLASQRHLTLPESGGRHSRRCFGQSQGRHW